MSDARVEARGVAKDYPRAGASGGVLTAVRPLDLELGSGSLTVITGRSGSGKSTLLSMLAGMLAPTSGTVLLDGADLYSLDERSRSRLRNAKIGLVPQGHTALRALSVLDNVLLPSVLYSRRRPPRQRAEDLLEAVGIAEPARIGPHELSGGELRRVAIARALFQGAGILLADEPTSDLDEENTDIVAKLLRRAADSGKTVFVVTHEMDMLPYADSHYIMKEGVLRKADDEDKSYQL